MVHLLGCSLACSSTLAPSPVLPCGVNPASAVRGEDVQIPSSSDSNGSKAGASLSRDHAACYEASIKL